MQLGHRLIVHVKVSGKKNVSKVEQLLSHAVQSLSFMQCTACISQSVSGGQANCVRDVLGGASMTPEYLSKAQCCCTKSGLPFGGFFQLLEHLQVEACRERG